MTNQEIYNKVRDHLLAQMRQSISSSGRCLYRGPNDLKCAIGALISDDKYSHALEGEGVNQLVLDAAGCTIEQAPLLCDLQEVHDGFSPEEWKNRLTALADQFKLER